MELAQIQALNPSNEITNQESFWLLETSNCGGKRFKKLPCTCSLLLPCVSDVSDSPSVSHLLKMVSEVKDIHN